MKLTAKQKRFVQEYLIDLNATQAAIRAGYSKKSAHSIGPENLEKPEIKQAIEEKLKQIDEEKTAEILGYGKKIQIETYGTPIVWFTNERIERVRKYGRKRSVI